MTRRVASGYVKLFAVQLVYADTDLVSSHNRVVSCLMERMERVSFR